MCVALQAQQLCPPQLIGQQQLLQQHQAQQRASALIGPKSPVALVSAASHGANLPQSPITSAAVTSMTQDLIPSSVSLTNAATHKGMATMLVQQQLQQQDQQQQQQQQPMTAASMFAAKQMLQRQMTTGPLVISQIGTY